VLSSAFCSDYYLNPSTKAYHSPDLINQVTKMPYGFEFQQAPAAAGGVASSGFHVFFDVNFSEEKTKRLLQYLMDGFYVDQVSGLQVNKLIEVHHTFTDLSLALSAL
jgi:hypothetical protein